MNPTPAQIDALLSFQADFDERGFRPAEVVTQPGVFPHVDLNARVLEFQSALEENGWIKPFDWTEWQERAEKLVNQPARLRQAGFLTIQRLFTTHVRKDRFCEGHFVEMIECGHIAAILDRLAALRAKLMETPT